MTFYKSALFRAAATAAIAGGAYAAEAQASATTPAVAQAAVSNSVNAGDNTNDSTGVAEIVVTAQKKSENLQKTAAAVTAVTGEALVAQGIHDIRAVSQIVPGARFQAEGNTTQVFLRGVGSNLDLPNIDQAVAFNFNGVNIPREGTSVPFFDIDHLEVLPGPQGTLYGRSAIGGVINVTFRRPTHELSLEGVTEGGNYSLFHQTLVGNVPLGDGLAARVGADYTSRSGYNTSGADSQNDVAVRASLLFDKYDNFKAYIWGYYVSKAGHPANLLIEGLDPKTFTPREGAFLHPDNPWNDTLTGPLAPLAPFGSPVPENQDYENYVLGGQFDYKFGNFTLSYIPSYIFLKAISYYWLAQFEANLNPRYWETSHELRLAYAGDHLDWLLGVYGYFDVNNGPFRIFPGATIVASNITRNRLEGIAAFGQATYHVTPGLRVTVGGRFSEDARNGQGFSAIGAPFLYDHSFSHFDYKIGLEYDITPKNMMYATYQTAYQPGTYNEIPNTPTQSNAVAPENLSAVSVGLKNRFLDNRLQINIEAYYYDYTDLFLQDYNATAVFNPIFNAKKVEVYGGQVDFVARVTKYDTLSSNIAYTHGEDKDFITPAGINYDGYSLPFTPLWQINALYKHTFDLQSGTIDLSGDVHYETSTWGIFTHSPGTFESAYAKFNASITYYNADKRFSFGFWVRNIGNIAVNAVVAPVNPFGYALLQPPRTFGVRAGFKF